jgi:UDP-3-O-[3-hydroxymyristoyl] glucosamine N-acyltransferase
VRLEAGARVGLDGFAFEATPAGPARIPHLGTCHIGDDVEIGANSTVDRGSVGTTRIGAGTKLDNLVHVGHNVRIGARCLVMAQTGMAGAVTVGDDVMIAGQAGLADHLSVGDRARIAAQSGVIGDVPPGAVVSGYPARDHRQVLRQTAALRRLTPLVPTLERLARNHDRTR